jgi:hypothetical protein
MGAVQQSLIHRVGMDRRHEAPDDGEMIVEDLYDGGQTVGGAGGIGNDVMFLGVVAFLIDAHAEGAVDPFSGSGNDHLECPGIQVTGTFSSHSVFARGFHDDLHAQALPRQVARIVRLICHPDLLAVYEQGVIV